MRSFLFSLFLCTTISLTAQNVSFISTGVTGPSACLGQQTTFVGSSVYADTSITPTGWKWDLDNDGQYDDAIGKSIGNTFPQSGSFPVSLKIVLNNGSSDSMPQPDTVIVNPLPQVNFMVENMCEGQTAVFTSNSMVSPGSINEYYWDFRNDGSDNDTGSVVTFNCGPAETYQTKLRCVSDKGCEAFALKTTQVFNQPVVNFTVQSACLGGNTSFTNNSTISAGVIDFYLWDFGDGDSSILAGPSHVFISEQTFLVKLTAISDNSCKASFSDSVTIAQLINAAFSVQNSCLGVTTQFTNNSSTLQGEVVSSYQWNFGDGFSGTTAGNATHEYSATGAYNVTMIAVSQNSCKDTVSSNVTVYQLPVVSMKISGDTINDSTIYEGDEITLGVNEILNSYLWSTGAATSSITITDSGIYSVTATNSNGCSQTLSKKIILKEIPDTAAAGNDIITPNGDGINDVFLIMDVSGYKQCAINIYNIWNEEVYSSSGYKNDWDGKNKNGNDLDAGAYFYILKCDDKEQTLGTVNILR